MIGEQKQVQEGGHATFSVKIPQAMYDLVNILCEGLQHGTNGNDLFKMFIQTFIESAKHEGPISPEMQHFLNLLKMEPGWHKAFNFTDVTASTEIAQVILILQQNGRHGFGLTMIDNPFMGESTETRCVDTIIERVIKLSSPELYKKLEKVGKRLYCNSIRETLTVLSEHMNDTLDKEEDREEMPGYGNYHDYGKPIEYGQRTKRKKHRTPDSLANSQQTIRFNEEDKLTAQDEVDSGKDMDKEMGFRPFGSEW